MRFHTTEQIGPTRSKTPEGFLLCQDVALARTGTMIYGPTETPVSAGRDGVVHIERDERDVFRPETISSLNGKPLTNDHPASDVTPDNWQNLAEGIVLHPRRGRGEMKDCIVGDILVTSKRAIDAVMSGKVEVSCGYDAEYVEMEPGRGRQRDIVFNHVALVDRGRCGPRCAIGDQDKARTENDDMRTIDKAGPSRSVLGKVLDLIRGAKGDPATLDAALAAAEHMDTSAAATSTSDGEDEHIHVHLDQPRGATLDAGTEARFAALESGQKKILDALAALGGKGEDKDKDGDGNEDGDEPPPKDKDGDEDADEDKKKDVEGQLEMEAPPGTNDKARVAKDSSYLYDSFRETVATAEILAPGIKLPTFDKSAKPAKTFDAICKLRREALDLAVKTQDGRKIIDEINGGRTVDATKMTCDAVRVLFRAAGAAKKATNRDGTREQTVLGAGGGLGVHPKSKIQNMADLNRFHAERYKTPAASV